MSLKTRLQRLEDAQKAKKAVYQETPESKEKTRQWINDTIEHIRERQRLIDEGLVFQGPPEPIKALPPDATHTQIWLHKLSVEAREKELRELDATRWD